ncbi:MAG: ABC transporter ATP-binding protein [Parasporobacterium sp.]|nr:ABC transporter ATP-binding protein [Parasporobacterium sp.]
MENILEVRNLKKSFGGIHAVRDVSFDIRKGEVLALVGPNGSGKSTCVNLISGMYTLDSGTITFMGKDITKEKMEKRVELGIGRTFQTPKPFTNLSVYDSVFTIALKYNKTFDQAAEKTIQILEKTDLIKNIDMKSGKLPIEKRKWLDLARVLAIEPKLIMFDEVMAGLNPTELEGSLDLIKQINEEGVSVLFIEHVMRAVMEIADRIIVLDEGQLLAEGLPEEVMSNPAVINAYIGGRTENAKD